MASALPEPSHPNAGVSVENQTSQCVTLSGDGMQNIINDTGLSDEETTQAKIVIPETPSPSMPKKQQHSRKNGSFDIAESVFSHHTSQNRRATSFDKPAKVKERHQDRELHNPSPSKSNSLPVASNKGVKSSSSSSFKVNTSKTASTSADSVSRQLSNKFDKTHIQESNGKVEQSSSSGSDDDIPLLQRIQKRRKIDKKNGTLSAISRLATGDVTKVSIKPQGKQSAVTSGKHSAEQNQHLTVAKRDLNFADIPHGKRVKVNLKSPKKDPVRTSSSKVTDGKDISLVRYESVSRTSGSSHQMGTHSGRNSQIPTNRNFYVSGHKHVEKQKKKQSLTRGDHVASYSSETELFHHRKSCAIEERDTGSEPSVSRAKKKKKSSPGNTTCNHKNNVIHEHIKELFGSDTESEGDVVEMKGQASEEIAPKRNQHFPTRRKGMKSGKNNLIVSDSSDTEPDVSFLVSKPRGKHKLKKMKPKSQREHVPKLVSSDTNSDDSDVEMMSADGSPAKSPVFNRTRGDLPRRLKSPVSNRTIQERHKKGTVRREGLPTANDIPVEQTLSSTSQSRKKNRRTEDRKHSESDVVTLDDEIEEVFPQRFSRRHGFQNQHAVLEGTSNQQSFELVSRLSGAAGGTHVRSELGTPINLQHLRPSSSSSNPAQPGPSHQRTYPGSPKKSRRRRNQDSGSSEERRGRNRQIPSSRTGRPSAAERRERQRQLEADEQLARDLASGRVRTPRSGGKRKKSDGRSRQEAEDEAMARDLASGKISTPVGQGPSLQIDDDEAFARQLQEQFNAEAMEAPHEDVPDMSVTTSVSSQYPFTLQYEMGMPSLPDYHPHFHRIDMTPGMMPVMFGGMLDSPPRGRRRSRGRGRGRTRGGRRGRNAGGVHIQFFPMDSSLDDDYESLWELADRVGPAVQQGLAPEVLSLLPTFCYKPDEAGQQGDNVGEGNGGNNCTICMMDYEEGDNLRRLPCFHDYHTACIDRWLTDNSACPVCQTRVSVDDHPIG